MNLLLDEFFPKRHLVKSNLCKILVFNLVIIIYYCIEVFYFTNLLMIILDLLTIIFRWIFLVQINVVSCLIMFIVFIIKYTYTLSIIVSINEYSSLSVKFFVIDFVITVVYCVFVLYMEQNYVNSKVIPIILYKCVDEKIGNQKSCSICLEEFAENDRINQTTCDHIFHETCLTNWIKNNPTCPICRKEQTKL